MNTFWNEYEVPSLEQDRPKSSYVESGLVYKAWAVTGMGSYRYGHASKRNGSIKRDP